MELAVLQVSVRCPYHLRLHSSCPAILLPETDVHRTRSAFGPTGFIMIPQCNALTVGIHPATLFINSS